MVAPITRVPVFSAPLGTRGAGLTHVGLVRDRNEDAILTDPSGRLWAVADGMGGYGQGDVAASLVIDAIAVISDGDDPPSALTASLELANARIQARVADRAQGPMGATVVALMVKDRIGYLAWAGDSRGYLLRDGHLRRLTRDHSVVQEMIDAGTLAPVEAAGHPERNIVTRAIGADPTLDVDIVTLPLLCGDRVLLCSDGLTGCVPDDKIALRLSVAAPPDVICAELMADALERGAPDNVSLIVIEVDNKG